MRLRYTAEANMAIGLIYEYIAQHNPAAATRVASRIRAAVLRLVAFPYMGRLGAVPGIHEWVVRGLPYIIVYSVDPDEDVLTVMDIFHAAQNRPRGPAE